MIGKLLIKVKNKIGTIRCKFHDHSFTLVREPSYMFPNDGRMPMFFHQDGLRYCEYCKRLERFTYHCLGLNPPTYIVDDNKEIDYSNLVGNLVQDPYNLEVEDLTMISMVHPELYDYCKLWLKES